MEICLSLGLFTAFLQLVLFFKACLTDGLLAKLSGISLMPNLILPAECLLNLRNLSFGQLIMKVRKQKIGLSIMK